MSLSETINVGLQNPDCAFFVGYYTGTSNNLLMFASVLIFILILRFIDKLAIEPLLKYIYDKIYNKIK